MLNNLSTTCQTRPPHRCHSIRKTCELSHRTYLEPGCHIFLMTSHLLAFHANQICPDVWITLMFSKVYGNREIISTEEKKFTVSDHGGVSLCFIMGQQWNMSSFICSGNSLEVKSVIIVTQYQEHLRTTWWYWLRRNSVIIGQWSACRPGFDSWEEIFPSLSRSEVL
jgi:hypothetical protein